MTSTTCTEDIVHIFNPNASSLATILDQAAGKFGDDFDMDAALADLKQRIGEAVEPFGLTVSGDEFLRDVDADIDRRAVAEAIDGIDLFDILQAHDISGK